MTSQTSRNRVRDLFPTHLGEFEGVFDQIFGPRGLRSVQAYNVAASVWEDEGSYHVELDVPGVARDDVELTFDKGTLVIATERKAPEEKRQGLVDERRYGKVTRTVRLPETIDPESIAAELSDGVLHVTVAKRPEAQPKRIEVK